MSEELNLDTGLDEIEAADILLIDIDGYEGPLHLLLMLARKQKVDLLSLSITRLADQYLAFVREARARSFSLAADYLVMAAYLAYLKSRLLLPKLARPAEEAIEPEAAAAQLSFQLAKLEAMRAAAEALKARPALGTDLFGRGDPEAVRIIPSGRIEGDLYSLMAAYIGQRKREQGRAYRPTLPNAYPLEAARERLRELLPELRRWTTLAHAAPSADEAPEGGPSRASFLASTLSASLELVKEGQLETRQTKAFADLYLRARNAA
ncbi:MAG: segregation and condensation protein [Caulobacteraceae bacterium]|nr:segregation and condensation protein [Caulobacteraceae bacterium]